MIFSGKLQYCIIQLFLDRSKMAKKTKLERVQARFLRQAENFCRAENKVQEARRMWQQLKSDHDPVDGICLTKFNRRSQCCKYCIDFLDNSPNWQDVLHDRRSAKSNMKRAFKALMKVRSESA